MLFFRNLEARQYLSFNPSRCLVPMGKLSVLQRLWKVRLQGCWYKEDVGSLIALLKLVWIELLGLAQKPKLERQYFTVKYRRWVVLALVAIFNCFCNCFR
jgi:hypothetical protein